MATAAMFRFFRKPASGPLAGIRPHLPALALFFGLTVVFTWPLTLHLSGSFMSLEHWYGGDPNLLIWLTDRIAHLTDAAAPPLDFALFWPGGVNVLAGYDGLMTVLFALPVAVVTGNAVLGYNLAVLAALWLNAAAAYALVWRETRSRYAASFGGVIFGFSVYALVRSMYHANLAMTFGLPLLLIAAQNWRDRPTPRRGLLLGLTVLVAALCSAHYLIIGGLTLTVFAAVNWRRVLTAGRQSLIAFASCLIAAAIPAIPLLWNRPAEWTARSSATLSALSLHWPNLILPHPLTDVFFGLTDSAYATFPASFGLGTPNYVAETAYVGIPLFILAAIGLLTLRKRGETERITFWSCLAILSFVFALGPETTVFGRTVPLPFALLRLIPPFSLIREPARLFLPGLLSLTVLASFALARLRVALIGKSKAMAAITLVLAAIFAAERFAAPVPLVAKRISPFYRAVAAEPDRFALAELPIGFLETQAGDQTDTAPRLALLSEYDFFQMTHNRPIVDGEYFYTALSPQTFGFINTNPLLLNSVCRPESAGSPDAAARQTSLSALAAVGVRYVIVHNLTLHDYAGCASAFRYIREFFRDDRPVFADGEITVYEVPGKPAIASWPKERR